MKGTPRAGIIKILAGGRYHTGACLLPMTRLPALERPVPKPHLTRVVFARQEGAFGDAWR